MGGVGFSAVSSERVREWAARHKSILRLKGFGFVEITACADSVCEAAGVVRFQSFRIRGCSQEGYLDRGSAPSLLLRGLGGFGLRICAVVALKIAEGVHFSQVVPAPTPHRLSS